MGTSSCYLVRASNGSLETSGWAISYDTTQLRESIVRLAAESPSFEVACAGHSDWITTDDADATETAAARR